MSPFAIWLSLCIFELYSFCTTFATTLMSAYSYDQLNVPAKHQGNQSQIASRYLTITINGIALWTILSIRVNCWSYIALTSTRFRWWGIVAFILQTALTGISVVLLLDGSRLQRQTEVRTDGSWKLHQLQIRVRGFVCA